MKNLKQLTTAAIMAAIMCILGPLSVPIGPVPVSLTVLFVFFAIYLLGTRLGLISYIIYLLLGLVGLPVFSGFAGGPAKLFGPTGGYLIGFIPVCIVSGLIIEKAAGKWFVEFAGMVLGLLILYAFGTAWLAFQAHISFGQALAAGVIPFIVFDIIKLVIAMLLGRTLRVRLKDFTGAYIQDDKTGAGAGNISK
ncbi:MAG: biotin transporter BioY [Lachnospiraceae bacterium]|nr:biotin transporter BioY [Lachnospiraceae bacterium]